VTQTASAPATLYTPTLATLVRSEPMAATERLFEFQMPDRRPFGHQPGQFVQVSVFGVGEAPFGLSSSPTRGPGFELVIRRMGGVTGALHALPVGAQVGVRGPLGTAFPIDEAKGKDVLFVGGGIGMVPLRGFIQYVLDRRDQYGRVIIFFGARSPAERLFTDELAQWGARKDVEFLETVDRPAEGWTGRTGVITTLFKQIKIDPARVLCAVCGPPVMYKFVIFEAGGLGIKPDQIFVSLERRMKCGVGKCGHCQLGPLYVCQDGPVFRFSDVQHLKERAL
jgi:sulfhydrogenase subunit gamma (sulfur reductase)